VKEEFIRFAPLFTGLSEDEQKIIAESFDERHADAGATLFEAGAASEALYLVGKGFVRLTTATGASLATLGPGSVLGEDGLFRNSKHELTATAVSELDYWALSDQHLRAIILEHPTIGIQLGQNFGGQLAQMQDYLIQALASTPEFSGMPRHTLEAVAAKLRAQTSAKSDVLYHAGEAPRGLFLVEEGTVELQPDTANSSEERTTLSAGQLVGVDFLLTNKPYTHSALAAEGAFLWALTAEQFQGLASQYPGLRRHLSRSVQTPLSRPDQAKAVMRLAQMPIFAELPPQTLQAIARRMVLEHAAAGERVYRIGEPGEALYLIDTGEVELAAENAVGVLEELARIGQDGYFGEMSLVSGQLRTEDATATRHTNLWTLRKADLDALSQQYPAIGKALSAGLAARLSSASANDVSLEHIRTFRLFADLSDTELRQIAQHLEPNRYRAGEQIFRASAPAESLFLLENGQVRIQPFSGGSWVLGPGEAFGERALLSNQPHNSTAVAETDVDVWTLSKEDFNQSGNQYQPHSQPANGRASRCAPAGLRGECAGHGARRLPGSAGGEHAAACARHEPARTNSLVPGPGHAGQSPASGAAPLARLSYRRGRTHGHEPDAGRRGSR
jgi:CRP-like cAMP-binding protein